MEKEDQIAVLKSFRKELQKFMNAVKELHKNAELSTKQDFLQSLVEDVNRLYASSIQAQKAQDATVEEIGCLVANLFNQPIAMKNHQNMTILKAVESFQIGKAEDCDLSFIMKEYVNHPASTKSFLIELSLLTEDLNEALEKIA